MHGGLISLFISMEIKISSFPSKTMCLKKIFSGRTTNLQAPQLHYAAGQFCIPATTGNVKNMQPYDPLFCSLLEKLQKGNMYPYSRTILTCFWWRNFLTGNNFGAKYILLHSDTFPPTSCRKMVCMVEISNKKNRFVCQQNA